MVMPTAAISRDVRPAFERESIAVEICERTEFTDLVAVQAYHGRGEAHFASAEPVAAIECYTRALELARGIGDKSYESENLMMLGYACTGYMGLADYAKAEANFEASLEIARKWRSATIKSAGFNDAKAGTRVFPVLAPLLNAL